jgi:hypothetical protein
MKQTIMLLLCAPIYGETITFSASPTYTPAALPSCGSEAFSVTQTAQYAWTRLRHRCRGTIRRIEMAG